MGSSRFSSPTQTFRALYAAEGFPTAFAEGVVRDQFEGKSQRILYVQDIEVLCLTEVSSDRELILLDLRGDGAYLSGVDTDVNQARSHSSGQAFSEELHAQFPEVEGILYNSRVTGGDCVMVYDRAFKYLSGSTAIDLSNSLLLPAEILRLDITLRRKRSW